MLATFRWAVLARSMCAGLFRNGNARSSARGVLPTTTARTTYGTPPAWLSRRTRTPDCKRSVGFSTARSNTAIAPACTRSYVLAR